MGKLQRCLAILLMTLFSLLNCFAFADSKVVATDSLALALEMFKGDEYLPAIDLLKNAEAELQQNFNFWLYLGLGYQRSGQTESAIAAYEQAAKINPEAGNLTTRIRSLRLETKRLDYKKNALLSGKEKSAYLMVQARQLRKEYQLDRAFRMFLQALAYDIELLKNDDDFITAGEVFYGLKKVDHAELFQGIFQFYQGEKESAEKNIRTFLSSAQPRPQYLISRAQEYLQKVQNIKMELALAANDEKIGKKPESAASGVKRPQLAKLPRNVADQNVEKLEQELERSTRRTQPDSGFVEFFAGEVAKKRIADLHRTDDPDRQCRIIWELGNSHLQDSAVMETLTSYLLSENVSVVCAALEAVSKIGSPAAAKAVDTLLGLMEHEELTIKFMAIETLGKIKEQPQKVIPLLVRDYAEEKDIYLKRHIYYWVNKFGKPGLQILYQELEDAARVDRRPVAELISRITGEKIQDLVDR